jgi:Zn-dependent peptidase ImmA (M78 family)
LLNKSNDKRIRNYLEKYAKEGQEKLKGLLASRTFRLYSILLEPAAIKRKATTRYHISGAIIYYNTCFDENTIRILIAHEVGHIVNKELLKNTEDSEQTANLFAYIALLDKNKFYTDECKQFISNSDMQIFNDMANTCPI